MERGIVTAMRAAALTATVACGATAAQERAPGGIDARTITVAGSPVTARVWTENGRSWYAISLDGTGWSEARETRYTLKLRHGDFDPLADAPAPAIEAGLAAGADTHLYIVQFVTQPLEAYRQAIRAAGGTVYAFIAQHAHVVRMDADAVEAVEALPFVRWVGPLHPAYRLEEFMLHNAAQGEQLFPRQRYNILTFDVAFDGGTTAKRTVAQRIEAIGGVVNRADAGKHLLDATLTPDQLFEVVRWDEVMFVDRWGPFESDMNVAREIGGADFLEERPENYLGQGVRGEIMDLGFNPAHVDFQSRPLINHGGSGTNSHGASTSGICFGDGTGDETARGMLPLGQGIIASSANMEPPNRYTHTGELVREPYNAVFATASVGSPRTFFYTTISADMDTTLFDFDFVQCQSQSNAGNQDSRPQAWAKNIISGGGLIHGNTLTRADDRWGNGASTGPASDGRVKPTLTHFYDAIRTTTCCGATSYTSSFGGTSGATPIICGHAGLFMQMWSDGLFGNPVDPDGTVFENRPHMTTAKAMLVNTAYQYDWTLGGPNGDLTRFRQGWGMPDLMNMYQLAGQMFIVNEDDVLGNMETATYEVTVAGAAEAPPIKATLVYADPAGVPMSSQHRVNDLSLRVTSPSGDVYWGNHGLESGILSTPGGSANEIDTVENVFVHPAEAGVWTIEVIASEINEDGHVETPELDVDFALVVSGVEPDGGCPEDLDGSGAIDFGDLNAILANWGPCPLGCPEDLDHSGAADYGDILVVLANWGPC